LMVFASSKADTTWPSRGTACPIDCVQLAMELEWYLAPYT